MVSLVVKNLPANARDMRGSDLISGSGRSPGVGNSTPLQTWRLKSVGLQRVRHNSNWTSGTKKKKKKRRRRREGGIRKDKGEILEVERYDGNTEWQVMACDGRRVPSFHPLLPIIPMLCLPDHSIESISLASFIPSYSLSPSEILILFACLSIVLFPTWKYGVFVGQRICLLLFPQ